MLMHYSHHMAVGVLGHEDEDPEGDQKASIVVHVAGKKLLADAGDAAEAGEEDIDDGELVWVGMDWQRVVLYRHGRVVWRMLRLSWRAACSLYTAA
jgi:hypothetical protein